MSYFTTAEDGANVHNHPLIEKVKIGYIRDRNITFTSTFKNSSIMKIVSAGILAISLMIIGCAPQAETPYGNPAADGFDIENSDSKAIAIADEVMEAMGGRAAYDNIEQFSWTFFGSRSLDWDKSKNTVEVNMFKDSTIIALDMNDNTGSAVVKGEEVANPDTVAMYLKRAKGAWINDSYWLVMPFKLKDSGVTLKYVSRDSTAAGAIGDKLALTFKEVGNTPNNKYEVIVSDENRLVEEWRFYTNATDSVPRFVRPWEDYKKYGDVLLSGGKGAISDLTIRTAQE